MRVCRRVSLLPPPLTPPRARARRYWCFTKLLDNIQDHYTFSQPGIQRMVLRLEELVRRIDATLADHLAEQGIQFLQFAFRWMNCLLMRELPLRAIVRLWDTCLAEGANGFEDFHTYVCAAFLCRFSEQLREMGMEELLVFLQAFPTGSWGDRDIEMLLSQAYILSTLFSGATAHLS